MVSYEAYSYRDNETGLRMKRDELLVERVAQIGSAPTEIAHVYARRISRIAGGAVAIAGALAIALAALMTKGLQVVLSSWSLEIPLTPILALTVALVPVAMLVGRAVAYGRHASLVRRAFVASSDVRWDLDRLHILSPAKLGAAHADALEVWSVAVPLMGWALVAPLASHLAIGTVMFSVDEMSRQFDDWILVSLLLTAIAHAVLALLALRFARKLRVVDPDANGTTPSSWAPLGWTALAGCLPGIVLYLIPPLIVLGTGLLFIPASFGIMKRRALTERALLRAHADAEREWQSDQSPPASPLLVG